MTLLRSNPFAVNVVAGGAGGAPAWFLGLPNLQWATPVGNWLGHSTVKDPLADTTNRGNTGHSCVIRTWQGMGLDQERKTAFMLRNGGHLDYYGNEVYELDFRRDALLWERVKDASSNSGGSPGAGPRASHSYFEHAGHNGRWFTPHTNSGSPSGSTNRNETWEFVRDSLTWINRGFQGNTGLVGGGSSDINPVTEQLVLVGVGGGGRVKVFDIADGAFNQVGYLSGGVDFETYAMVAIDTTNNILLVQERDDDLWSLDLNNVSGGFQAVSSSGSRQRSISQMVWHPASNAFLGWGAGSTLVKLSVTVDGSNRYSSAVFSSVPIAGSAPSDQSEHGLYDKVNLVRDMGNGDAMLVVVPRYANPDVYVARVIGGV